MGRVLQIRVSAVTVSPSDVGWNWSKLSKLVFGSNISDSDKKCGVLELVHGLEDDFKFGNWPEEFKEAVRPALEEVVTLKREIEAALTVWNPGEANRLSNLLEDALDKLEDRCPSTLPVATKAFPFE